MAPPVTNFAVKDPYKYLEGLGNYHQSEVKPGCIPIANNHPQRPPYNLLTERVSGSSFTAPREQNIQTWLYRAQSSLEHGEFVPLEVSSGYGSYSTPRHLTPNSYNWMRLPTPAKAHWVNGQQLVGRNGDPAKKEGCSVWVFSVNEDMPDHHAFSSVDGEMLIVPQSGALNLRTELGGLMVRQNEIAVVPRGIRYRVDLVSDEGADGYKKPCRGYVIELHQGHFRLPDLGIIGSTGLANPRDFQVPTAWFDGDMVEMEDENEKGEKKKKTVAQANNRDWHLINRLAGRLWHCHQSHTPFDVAGWGGTNYPYKFDLARFCVLGNVAFDHHDPSLFTVLTARNHASSPGTAVVDFAVIPPRYMVSEDTFWNPYFHRNTMQEFFFPIINAQDPRYPFNSDKKGRAKEFSPFAAGLHASMNAHGSDREEVEMVRNIDTFTPTKIQTEGISIALVETERPLELTDWAFELADRDPSRRVGVAKM